MGSHIFTCKFMHACLLFVSVRQMALSLTEVAAIRLQLLIYRSRRDVRLSWPSWLTYSGWFAHMSGHPSTTGRALDREVRRPKTDVLPLCYATQPGAWHYFAIMSIHSQVMLVGVIVIALYKQVYTVQTCPSGAEYVPTAGHWHNHGPSQQSSLTTNRA